MTGDSSKTRFGDKNNNPNHFIVLDAISKGAKDIDDLVKTTRLPREEVDLIVNDLSSQRLIIKEEKKRRFFGGKKVEVNVTETGGEDSSQIGEADTSGDFGGFDAGGFGDF